jgi:hypothetical protein
MFQLTLPSIPVSWFIHRKQSYRFAIAVGLLPLISLVMPAAIFISGAVFPAR